MPSGAFLGVFEVAPGVAVGVWYDTLIGWQFAPLQCVSAEHH